MKRFSKLIEWAFSGSKTAMADSDKRAGYAEREVPRNDEYNSQHYLQDQRINDNAFRLNLLGPVPPAVARGDICSRLQYGNTQWHDPTRGLHYLEHTAEIIDSCIGWDWTLTETLYDRPCLFFLDDAGDIFKVTKLWDADEALDVSSALSLTFPYTTDGIFSICSDASYLYVLWRRDSDDHLWVSRYSLTAYSGNPEDDTDTGVAATDTELFYQQNCRLICADASNLAILIPDTVDSPTIAIMSKDGVSYASGQGNDDIGTYRGYLQDIVSDGTAIYWLNRAYGSDDTYICHAYITDPTTYANAKKLVSGDSDYVEQPNALLAMPGPFILIVDGMGRFWQYDFSDNAIEALCHLVGTRGESLVQASYQYTNALGFDGTSVWYQKPEAGYSSTTDFTMSIYKMRGCLWGANGGTPAHPDVYGDRISTEAENPIYGLTPGRLLFDGRSMFFVARAGSDGTNGSIMRICNPQGR